MPNSLPKVNLTQTIPLILVKRRYFPSISRFIPEASLLHTFPVYWIKISSFSIISAILLALTYNQYTSYIINQARLARVTQERIKLNKELNYWKEMSVKYNNYPDIHLKIAEIEYRLGNAASAKSFIDKALSLNPEMEQGRVLGIQIGR